MAKQRTSIKPGISHQVTSLHTQEDTLSVVTEWPLLIWLICQDLSSYFIILLLSILKENIEGYK